MANTTCTLKKDTSCGGCSFHDAKSCKRGNPRRMKIILASLAVHLLASFGGLAAVSWCTGAWFVLPLHFLFWCFYYGGVEPFLHCPRCPYWNDGDAAISCLLHAGIPKPRGAFFEKLLRYNPKPYTLFEQTVLQICNYYGTLFPLAMLGWALMQVRGSGALLAAMGAVTALYILTAAWFLYYVYSRCCIKCVHFSCPVNRQSPERVLEYLDKNPELKKAWVQAGKYPDRGSRIT
jgi:hypothetical protein